MSKDIAIIGGGGHAKPIIDALLLLKFNIIGIYDDNPYKQDKIIYNGIKVIGLIENINLYIPNFICAIGNNAIREKIINKFNHLNWITIIHPKSYISPSVSVGNGTFINAGAVIQSDVKIGNHVIINTGTCVDHDCIIDNFCHIGPNATLCGYVHLHNNVMIGAGTVIINNSISIYSNSIIGAGSVVLSNIDKNVVAVGVPCKKIKDII